MRGRGRTATFGSARSRERRNGTEGGRDVGRGAQWERWGAGRKALRPMRRAGRRARYPMGKAGRAGRKAGRPVRGGARSAVPNGKGGGGRDFRTGRGGRGRSRSRFFPGLGLLAASPRSALLGSPRRPRRSAARWRSAGTGGTGRSSSQPCSSATRCTTSTAKPSRSSCPPSWPRCRWTKTTWVSAAVRGSPRAGLRERSADAVPCRAVPPQV